ncbi:MAG: MFS transporter [Chthoniobacteraceae bacterium]|jgi:FHS family L-fucose permease-like MFS transporter
MHEQTAKKSIFTTPDGKRLAFTFLLVSSLFLLWGFCNGMIDVMDKHFQEVLHLTLAQSAWVQFAHYLGYTLMSLPAGILATRLGYRGGIIAGLLLVAVGGYWFLAATHIAQFWAFLLGVCVIASGLTFLETVANPYTTVLGDQQYAATRINLAQSCNGIGWVYGPLAGAAYFYSKDASGHSTGSATLWIPYVSVAVVVTVLAVVFSFAHMPDIKVEDDYHLDEGDPNVSHSIWSHPHFVMAVVAQFLYVAAQAGIFSFFINYMTSQTPGFPASITTVYPHNWLADAVVIHTFIWGVLLAALGIIFLPSATQKPGWLALSAVGVLLVIFSIYRYNSPVSAGIRADSTGLFSTWFTPKNGALTLTDNGAANLASLAFVCFLAGRFSGAAILRTFKAHKVLGLYGFINAIICGLIFLKLGWFSVVCIFLSYFFMSIMFPTIFALGIHGLGTRAKKASAFIVMAIMGGAILPKLMGYVGDKFDMSRAFIVPLGCFAFVAFYGFNWARLAKSEGVRGMSPLSEH